MNTLRRWVPIVCVVTSMGIAFCSFAVSANALLAAQSATCLSLATVNYYELGDSNYVGHLDNANYDRLLKKDQEASREVRVTIRELKNFSMLGRFFRYFKYRSILAKNQKSLQEVYDELHKEAVR